MRIIRQGDVLVAAVKQIPEGLVEVPRDQGRVVLAYGEVTGHAHVVDGEATLLAADVDEMQERFLRVEAECELVHDEHTALILPPGDYRVVRQREYAPAANVLVAD